VERRENKTFAWGEKNINPLGNGEEEITKICVVY
jgi:hypothetical protein